ncbi:MAG: formate/nitrite transporter family protein [Slackia sp.]|nr:formate/nitrite transporter family protein [Slackia sp.]
MAVLDDSEVKAVRPDALAPAEIEAKAESVAVGKAAMSVPKVIVLAMLAGAFIAFGALYFCVFLGDPSMPFAVQRAVGGLCFCLGLVLVLCCGAELFTGNMLMVCALASKKITLGAMLKNWGLVWFGNLAGALVAVALVYFAHIADMNGGAVGGAMISVAVSKVTPDWITLFCKGILCNIFVCLAVWIGFGARTVVDKVIGILLPISAFVACGFEHCVANMFFLPMGLLAKASGYTTAVDASALDFGGVLLNLSAATLGNIVGGALFVGLAYWFVFHAKKES